MASATMPKVRGFLLAATRIAIRPFQRKRQARGEIGMKNLDSNFHGHNKKIASYPAKYHSNIPLPVGQTEYNHPATTSNIGMLTTHVLEVLSPWRKISIASSSDCAKRFSFIRTGISAAVANPNSGKFPSLTLSCSR